MSRYLEQTSCPRCPSSDAFTVYADGSGYCFSCGHFKAPLGRSNESMRKVLDKVLSSKPDAHNVQAKGIVVLPSDCNSYIPPEPMAWIKQYGITNDEIRKNHICYSPERQMLIFPFFDGEGNCIFWQGRYFPKRQPKVYSEGFSRTALVILPSQVQNETLCAVEDPVSAIKVSREVSTLCLFGSHLHMSTALYTARSYTRLILWLDSDKAKEASKMQQRYSYLFKDGIHVVRTEHDPKVYTTEQIKQFLTN